MSQPFVDGKRVELKKWNAVAYWSWLQEGNDNQCTICTNALEQPCLCVCMANPHLNEECTISFGKCTHAYHSHCILSWLKKGTNCPKCDEVWEPDIR